MDLTSQLDDSDSETPSMLFKKPRISLRRKEIPTGTIASEKLKYIEGSFHQDFSLMYLKIEGEKVKQKVRPLSDRYIVDLAAMVSTLSEVASCKKCNKGEMELFEMNSRATCASKLVFRCCACNNSIVFMNVGEINSDSTNLLDLSCVLGGRIVDLNPENLRTFYACLDLPPPPMPSRFTKIQEEVLAFAEKEAEASMERATKELKSEIAIDPSTQCVHVSASIDGAYHSSSCFSSIVTTKGKALAYKVASNSCYICTRYQNKDKKSTLSELERQKWDDHSETCPAEYSEYTNYHLETAVAPELIKQAHERGIVFHTLVSDGDSDAVESLNTSETYLKLGINQNIKRIESLSHVMRAMMNDLIKNQLNEGEGLMEEASVESQP